MTTPEQARQIASNRLNIFDDVETAVCIENLLEQLEWAQTTSASYNDIANKAVAELEDMRDELDKKDLELAEIKCSSSLLQYKDAIKSIRKLKEWKDAVLNSLADHALDAPMDMHPKDILKMIIDTSIEMAMDPKISKKANEYQKLNIVMQDMFTEVCNMNKRLRSDLETSQHEHDELQIDFGMMISKKYADIERLKIDNNNLRECLRRIRQWDALYIPNSDGEFWKEQIDRVLK
jgi:hypothetical protein